MIFLKLTLILNLFILSILGFYPVYAWLKSVFFSHKVKKSDNYVVPVSIIIACNNEESFIRQKLDSFLAGEEWIEGSEIIVVSNGSTDSTNKILEEYKPNPYVKIIEERSQITKILAVNKGVEQSKHDLLVFSDCRQTMEKGSVRRLVSNFNDPDVGTVNSTLKDSGPKAGFSFRSILSFVSHCESQSDSSLNVFGALYAQQKSVFRKFPADMLFDDLFVVVSTLLQEKRLVTEEKAVIYDVPFSDYYMQNRIHRLTRGLLIFLFNHFDLIRKLPLNYFLRFLVFKYLKLILPVALIFISIDLFILCYYLPVIYQLVFLLIAITLIAIRPLRKFIFHFLFINFHFFVATLEFLFFNKRSNRWDKLSVNKIG